MPGLKDWKNKPFDIEAFRDAWGSNFRVEVASGLLYALKNAEEISKKDKAFFLLEVLTPLSISRTLDGDIFFQALEYFFDILPEWDADSPEMLKACKAIIINVLIKDTLKDALNKPENRDELKKKFSGKIRKFLNSFLNNNKKEDGLLWGYVARALLYNEMFEELVNYSFTSIEVLQGLATRLGIANGPRGREAPEIYGFNGENITAALARSREPKVISAFLRLLAKRSSNGNIFDENNGSAGTVYIHNGIIYTKLS